MAAIFVCCNWLGGRSLVPQVSGQYSRRRDKANRRMEFAAQRRKERKPEGGTDPAATAPQAVENEQPGTDPSADQGS